jgi:ribosomal protein L11 methyltransferase
LQGCLKNFIKPNGILILSGIITERCNEVIEAMNNNGYKLIEMHEKEGWAAVSFK